MSFKGYRWSSLDVVVPEDKRDSYPVLWLLSDVTGRGDDFLRYTMLEDFCRKSSCYVVCVSIGPNDYEDHPDEDEANWESYVTIFLWDLMHQIFPKASEDAGSNYIAGVGSGIKGARHFQKNHSEKYGKAFGLSEQNPEDWKEINDELGRLLLQMKYL